MIGITHLREKHMHLKKIYTIAALLAVVLLAIPTAYAGGGKKRKRMNNPDDPNVFDWDSSLNEAEESAAEDKDAKKPVMAVVYRPGNEEDKKALERLSSWPSARDHSHKDVAAVKISADDPDMKKLCESFNVKSLPVIFWMDPQGNVLSMQSFPQLATELDKVPAGWAALTSKVDAFLKDHMDRGQKYAAQGKLREAYREFALLSQFRGPLPALASDRRKFVAEQWNKLLNIAKQTADKKQRAVILKGIERETVGLDIERDMHEAIALIGSAEIVKPAEKDATPANANQPVVADKGGQTAAQGSAVPQPPAAPEGLKAIAQEKPPEVKTLGDLASAAPSVAKQESDDGPMGGILLGRDAKLKDAYAQLQGAMADYRKATADATDRGPARNGLLKSAYEKFSGCMNAIEEATAAKADAQLDKLQTQISMMMYGCLKYQSL